MAVGKPAERPGGPLPEAGVPLVFREHWRVLVRPVAVLFLVVGAAAFLASIAPDRDGRMWARLAVLVLALAAVARWTVVPWLRWLTDKHVVEDGRLVVRSGLVTQEGRAIALARVQDVTFTQDSLLERVLGIGTLVVTPDDGREPMELVGVGHVEQAQAQLLRLVDLARDAAYYAGRDGTG
ncbi:PH domain-containing protein [Yinghuangia soli]|uniref:PH domain-containing protein n=1 Tax=Yinghuangia soli TaxID=2908204 RepID=A0AA41Q2M9_9ACTN|nr:PH domain-containing protein [Yinghuangia soli]MCF2529835.1 PH domain-containing protein [Yinghuangia soli]